MKNILIAIVFLGSIVGAYLWAHPHNVDVHMVIFGAIMMGVCAILLGLLIMRNMTLENLNRKLALNLDTISAEERLLTEQEKKLQESNNKLKELDRTKTDFILVAAHQLRTPLTGIRWSFDLLLDPIIGVISEQHKRTAQIALKSTERMVTLVDSLLQVARIEEGKSGFIFKKTPFGDVLQKAFESTKSLFEKKHITLHAELSPTLPSIPMDQEKLAVAFANILENAALYSKEKGAVSVLGVATESSVTISIEDHGIGIPKKDVDSVGQKFFRASNVLLHETEGNGLGYYVADNIIKAHGGTLAITSEENRGTKVVITLSVPEA